MKDASKQPINATAKSGVPNAANIRSAYAISPMGPQPGLPPSG
jgi:hypothetical protein